MCCYTTRFVNTYVKKINRVTYLNKTQTIRIKTQRLKPFAEVHKCIFKKLRCKLYPQHDHHGFRIEALPIG